MRVVSHTEHLHTHTDDGVCRCGEHHSHVQVQLRQTVIGLIFVINSFLVGWVLERGSSVGDVSAMIGAMVLGAPIVWTAIKDLRGGALSTNELVALAVIASFSSGHYQEAGVVSFFMLLGQIIETRTAEGARLSIESLIKLTPTKARRVTDDGKDEVAVQDLAAGDLMRVRPGDNVAADGVIATGQGSFNQANITGESLPVDKKPGDEVFAGTVNLTGVLEIRVTRVGPDTTLGRVRDLILAAEKTKLPIMRIACADLLPELQFHSHDRGKLSLALLAGIGVAVLVGKLDHSGHDHQQREPTPARMGGKGIKAPANSTLRKTSASVDLGKTSN